MVEEADTQKQADISDHSPYGGLAAYQQDAATLLMQTNPAGVLVEIEHQLRGEIYDSEDDKWIDKKSPLLNEKGINGVMSILKSIVNTNCILSNLSEKRIQLIIENVGKNIADLLLIEFEDYGVKKSNLSTIVFLCCNMCYFALMRGYDEGERKFLKTTQRSTEHITVSPPQQAGKRTFADRLFK